MAFNPILGVGKEPGRQPAVIQFNEEITKTVPTTMTSTVTIQEPINAKNVYVLITFVSGQNATTPANITLFRNGSIIDELDWNVTIATIQSDTGQNTLYKYSRQVNDFYSSGDEIKIQMGLTSGGGLNMTASFVFLIQGWFL